MPSSPQLVFLYGPPAVGKLTVAEELAKLSPFRVLHNHVTIDAVVTVLPFGSKAFWHVVGRLRRDLVNAAAREGIDLVYTYVFAPGDESHVDVIARAYEEVGGTVTFVRLTAPREELVRRVGNESRAAHGKITDVATLEGVLAEHDVFVAVPRRESLTIDVGTTSAVDAARLILEHLAGS
jgi:hypothetical protein